MQTDDFALKRYLARIGLDAAEPPGLKLLAAVIAHHAAAIPFENLDIILGRPIALDIATLQAKLVDSRRGGYCFEQNTLLRAALRRLGFHVGSMMARVVRGAPAGALTPRVHMLLRVDLPDGAYLADVGFGNLTPTAPLTLYRIDAQPTKHEDYRLQSLENETLLQVRLGDTWDNVYRFSHQPSYDIDHEVANWYTSTSPGHIFTSNVIAARAAEACRITLLNDVVTTRNMPNLTERRAASTPAALRDALHDQFGIDLTAPDLDTIYAATKQFAERPGTTFSLD